MILCVEDDAGIRELMAYTLNSAGFETIGLPDGTDLDKTISKNKPELIILDIMLPGEDGISILKRLRANPDTAELPIILATAKGTEYDKVLGLDLGADDYLAKPFGMMEMISRVKAVLRRTKQKSENNIIFAGALKFDTKAHTVSVNDTEINLTLKEYELLENFIKHPHTVFTREELLAKIWGTDFIGETRTVDVHIGTLRNKLLDYGSYITTVRGVGYKWEMK